MQQPGQVSPTALVVEDDPVLRAMVEDALVDGGFEVMTVGSAEEAIAFLKAQPKACHVLVTDIHLGGKIEGWEVARTAREIDPAFPIIYMTGAAGDEWPSKGVPGSILLSKPFASAQLVTAVSQLLNTSSPSL